MKRYHLLVFLSLFLSFSLTAKAQTLIPVDTEEKAKAYKEDQAKAKEKAAAVTLKISDLAIAKSLGKIDDRFVGTSDRWVVYIQDVHAHFSAQENIAGIADQLSAVYKIKTFALEGGWQSTSFPTSWGLPSSAKKQMLARNLLEDAYLTGPSFAALFSAQPIMLIGIEDQKLYEENRQVYLKHLGERTDTLSKLDTLAKKIEESKKTIFNPALLSFDHSLAEFREGKKAEQFLPSLIELASTKAVDLSDLAQIGFFKDALQKEKSIDKVRLEDEAKRLMQLYKNLRLSLEEILRSGQVPDEKLDYYPSIKKYFELMKTQDKITHHEFFTQIEESIHRLKEKLFASEEEKALDAKSEDFLLAKKIILFQATPMDLKQYEKDKGAVDSELAKAGLGDALKLGLNFYDIAKKRDEVFFNKITTDDALKGDIAVVTGGFHSEGLSQRLREAGISYVVITPDLANEAPNEALYFKRLAINPPVAATQALSQPLGFFDNGDQRFMDALKFFETQENNVTKASFIAEGPYALTPVSGGSGRASTSPVSQKQFKFDLDMMADKNIPLEKKKEEMKKWIDLVEKPHDGKINIVLVVKTSILMDLFKMPAGEIAFKKGVAIQRANTIGIIRDNGEYPEQLINIKSRIVPLSVPETGLDINAIVDARFKTEKMKKIVAVIDTDFKSNDWVLGLPAEPLSFLTARLILEYGFPRTISSELQTLLQDIFREIFTESAALEKAA